MKLVYVVIDIVTSLFLALCISLSLAVAPTAESLVPPAGSPIAKEQAGDKRIADMEAAAQVTLNAPVNVLSSQGGKTGYELRAEAFADAQQRIDIEKQLLNREVAHDEWQLRQDTKKLDTETPEQWVDRMTNKFKIYPRSGTRIIFADSTPCDEGTFKRSGCVTQNIDFFGRPMGGDINLYLVPDAVGDIYILFHEIGHTKGILDECTADHYSRSITGLPGGFYC